MNSIILLLAGLQIKHFIADYLMQPNWMIAGKSSLKRPGGYVHAAIHALGSFIVLMAFGAPLMKSIYLVVGEAILHFVIDFVKARTGTKNLASMQTRSFWAAHGLDQLAHHLTYTAMIYLIVG